jgi:hypothetical protein
VHECVDLVALEQLAHLVAVPDVGLDELVLRPGARRRAQVDVDDLLGLLATRELVGEAPSDLAGTTCNQVPHSAILYLAGWPVSASDRSPSLLCGLSAELPATQPRTATSREFSC